ncbi:hypothetical protein AOLI_G00090200 [Acnodon oligacanthus]
MGMRKQPIFRPYEFPSEARFQAETDLAEHFLLWEMGKQGRGWGSCLIACANRQLAELQNEESFQQRHSERWTPSIKMQRKKNLRSFIWKIPLLFHKKLLCLKLFMDRAVCRGCASRSMDCSYKVTFSYSATS